VLSKANNPAQTRARFSTDGASPGACAGPPAHLAGGHVAPQALLGQRVALHGDVAGLRERQLQHQRARVVRDAAHDVQAPRRARDDHVVLRAADLCSAL